MNSLKRLLLSFLVCAFMASACFYAVLWEPEPFTITQIIAADDRMGYIKDGLLFAGALSEASAGGQSGGYLEYFRNVPLAVEMEDVSAAAFGKQHTLAATKDGTLYAWGDNRYGQLGTNSTESADEPAAVMKGVAAVAAGSWSSYALTESGELYAWGYDLYGQLGLGGGRLFRAKPGLVLKGVAAVDAAYSAVFALTETGELFAWGRNRYGQLGTGDIADRSTPVRVAEGVVSFSCGGYHSLIQKEDGFVYGAGLNADGQIGVYTDEKYQTAFTRIGKFAAFDTGRTHSVFADGSGALYASGQPAWDWGYLTKKPGPDSPLVMLTFDVFDATAGNGYTLIRHGHENPTLYGDKINLRIKDDSPPFRLAPQCPVCRDFVSSQKGPAFEGGLLVQTLGYLMDGELPDWYGGYYFCENGNLHLLIAGDMEAGKKALTKLMTKKYADAIPLEPAAFSYAELAKARDSIKNGKGFTLDYNGWLNVWIDQRANMVLVGLFEEGLADGKLDENELEAFSHWDCVALYVDIPEQEDATPDELLPEEFLSDGLLPEEPF